MASPLLSLDVAPATASFTVAAIVGSFSAAVLLLVGRFGGRIDGLARFGLLAGPSTVFLLAGLLIPPIGLFAAASLVVVGLCLGVEHWGGQRVPTVIPAGAVGGVPLVALVATVLESGGLPTTVGMVLLAALVGTYLGGLVVAAVLADGDRLPAVVDGSAVVAVGVAAAVVLLVEDPPTVGTVAEIALFAVTSLAFAAFGWWTDEPRRRHLIALGTAVTPVLAVAPVADPRDPASPRCYWCTYW